MYTCRFQILQGKKVRFVPGWDCHGLPIELKGHLINLNIIKYSDIVTTFVDLFFLNLCFVEVFKL